MNIYFSGIGGVGIGPLAEIAFDAGYNVAGSDPQDTLMTKELQKKGITVSTVQDGSFLLARHREKPIDWLIYTSALPDDHPELIMAQKLGIQTAKRDELIAYIVDDKSLKLIAIAGTHGKTTTTAMMVWTMQQLGIHVSYSIGTTIKFGPSGKLDPLSEYFVYECDEFDRNFLHFNPYLSIITSIDYDHPDTYPTINEYLEAFSLFALKSSRAISWDDQHRELFDDMPRVKIINSSEVSSSISIKGAHNRRNATLVQKAMQLLGFAQSTDNILSRFPGTDRRFEKLADNLYSDYGHHPTEIAATLQLASELSSSVVLVYQPHQNLRQHKMLDQYTNQFEQAETIYWLPTYLSREDPTLPILEPAELIKNITNKNAVHIIDFNDELWDIIQTARREGKLVLFMGAGKIDSWLRDKLVGINQ